jgi:ketosteroid isomerase-like protein
LFTKNHGRDPNPDLAVALFEAIGRKAWREVEELTAPEIVLKVQAAPGIRSRRNEHLWRSVALRGRDDLRAYLVELHHAMPALTLQVRATSRSTRADRQVVMVECSGVDNAGSPFEAETDFTLRTRDGTLRHIEARVNQLSVGGDVIRRTQGDPRKYFRNFLRSPA